METPKNWRNPDGSPMTCREECDKPVKIAGCNTSLGQMQESPERIRGLLTYLERTRQ